MEPGKKSCNIELVSDDLSVTETKPLDQLLARKLRGAKPQTSNNPGKIARIHISFSEYAQSIDAEARLDGVCIVRTPYEVQLLVADHMELHLFR